MIEAEGPFPTTLPPHAVNSGYNDIWLRASQLEPEGEVNDG